MSQKIITILIYNIAFLLGFKLLGLDSIKEQAIFILLVMTPAIIVTLTERIER